MPLPYPSAGDDPVIRLHDYYFQPCDLLFKKVNKLFQKLERDGRLTPKPSYELRHLAQLWLATLYVVSDGFGRPSIIEFYNSLPRDDLCHIHWSTVRYQREQLGPELRKYRNVTFHFQENMSVLEADRLGFFRHPSRRDPIGWASELHREIQCFYQAYRVNAFVRVIMRKHPEIGSSTAAKGAGSA